MKAPDLATVSQLSAATTVAVVLAGLLLTGPLVGVVPLDDPPAASEIGDGTATVSSVSLSDRVTLSEGRFGTDVRYVRMPPAAVDVASTEGRSRLVYRVVVPALDVDRTVTRTIEPDGSGTYRLTMRDIAVSPDAGSGPFEGRVTIRVQSFTGETTVYNETVTVGGGR